jgi:Sec-independent protein secretion pathway component TatC
MILFEAVVVTLVLLTVYAIVTREPDTVFTICCVVFCMVFLYVISIIIAHTSCGGSQMCGVKYA